jgi:uncharacterized membrane protein YphA (DoxX/SURF4 family)
MDREDGMALGDVVGTVRGAGKVGVGVANAFAWFAPLLARVTVGVFLMAPSTWESEDLGSGAAPLFHELRLPLLVAGVLLILGLASRVTAVGVAAVMALAFAKSWPSFTYFGAEFVIELTDLVLALVIVIYGPGPVSLDRGILGWLTRRERLASGGAR